MSSSSTFHQLHTCLSSKVSSLVFIFRFGIDIIIDVWLFLPPQKATLGVSAQVHQIKSLLGDVIKSNHLLVLAVPLIIPALVNFSFQQGWIVHDVFRNYQVCGFGFQVSFVNAVFEFIAFLSLHLEVASLTNEIKTQAIFVLFVQCIFFVRVE